MSDETNTEPLVIDPANWPPRMDVEELREFVLGLCNGQIFTSEHLRKGDLNLLSSIFMPLIAGTGALLGMNPKRPSFQIEDAEPIDMSEAEIKTCLSNVGVFWEWEREAGPRSLNGYPMFLTLNVMHKEDWRRAVKAYHREIKRRKEIPI